MAWGPTAEVLRHGVLPGVAPGGAGGLAMIWRPLVVCVVAGFAALGTLMSVGLMMLPAIAARHFCAHLAGQRRAAVGIAVLSSLSGLLLSYHADLPAGPAIVLVAGLAWAAGMLAGPHASVRNR